MMAAQTEIGWTDSTHNHWVGCTKISPACDNCYAAALMDTRLHRAEWGAGKPRVLTSEANRRKPLQWNEIEFHECTECGWRGEQKQCAYWESPPGFLPKVGPAWSCPKCYWEVAHARRRVFCSSLADVFDNEVPTEWLADLLDLIRRTPNLDWQLLTKRIGNWKSRLQEATTYRLAEILADCADPKRDDLYQWLRAWLDSKPPANVWIGATICNQAEADRDVPKLLRVPAAVRFLSIEPMLGPVNLKRAIWGGVGCGACHQWGSNPRLFKRRVCTTCDRSEQQIRDDHGFVLTSEAPQVHQIITGGESGANARPSNPQWFRGIRNYCVETGIAYFHKQNGEFVSVSEVEGPGEHFTFSDGRTVRRRGFVSGRRLDTPTAADLPDLPMIRFLRGVKRNNAIIAALREDPEIVRVIRNIDIELKYGVPKTTARKIMEQARR